MNFPTEYLDIFGDQATFQRFTETINKEAFATLSKKCLHSKASNEDGVYICKECGMSKCLHENMYESDGGLRICEDCGIEETTLEFDSEWKYTSRDTSRCHRTKSNTRSIDKVFDESKADVPEAIRALTEKKVKKIVGDETVRGKGRKAIVAASLLHVYRAQGDIRTSDEIRTDFNLSKKSMSAGLRKYYEKFPDDRTKHVQPEDLIRRILILTNIPLSHYRKIVHIAKYLENSSRLLNHSSPQSVASAIVYLYLCMNPELKNSLDLTKTRFAERAKLSDITVTKLVKEASVIVGCVVQL